MGGGGRATSPDHLHQKGYTIREFGIGGTGGGPTSSVDGGPGQHGAIYIRSYR